MDAPSDELNGPVVQSIATGFRVLYVAIVLLGAGWVASNWKQVPAESQAVLLRFGRVVGVQQAGLALSWPRPIGAVELIPGRARQLTLRTRGTARSEGLEDIYTQASGAELPEGAGSYLTGDGAVVLLAATMTYQVTDAARYYLAQAHVPAALQRVFQASAVGVVAHLDLDDILVARPDRATPEQAAAAEDRRHALRDVLLREMNRRLAALDLGVEISRLDLEPSLPPAAKIAFDGVLVAVQLAEQGIAAARTEAMRTAQAADRERDRLLTAAQAGAVERVTDAQSKTAPILALQAGMTGTTRPAILDHAYRDALGAFMPKVGRVMAIDSQGGARVLLPATP